ncbi:MAG: hypothetical protein CM15mP87_09590 [Candidatus Neomarinimicrobiota bacterium]|nr:MAG: hypothetical protein CM15mP87_09590 [Candidatus Neomarinimicrobiota bacterium]
MFSSVAGFGFQTFGGWGPREGFIFDKFIFQVSHTLNPPDGRSMVQWG